MYGMEAFIIPIDHNWEGMDGFFCDGYFCWLLIKKIRKIKKDDPPEKYFSGMVF